MTTENGATDGDVKDVNIEVETKTGQDGGNDANVAADELKKELVTRDKKIAELLEDQKRLKEIEKQRETDAFEKKSVEEKLESIQSKYADMEREQILSRKLSGLGVSVEEANKVLNGATAQEQAEALAEIIKNVGDSASTSAVEGLKTKMLEKTQKDTPSAENKTENDAFTAGLKRGAGMK